MKFWKLTLVHSYCLHMLLTDEIRSLLPSKPNNQLGKTTFFKQR